MHVAWNMRARFATERRNAAIMNKKISPPEPSGVQEIALREALEERYLAYALSTIMHRALPDAEATAYLLMACLESLKAA